MGLLSPFKKSLSYEAWKNPNFLKLICLEYVKDILNFENYLLCLVNLSKNNPKPLKVGAFCNFLTNCTISYFNTKLLSTTQL